MRTIDKPSKSPPGVDAPAPRLAPRPRTQAESLPVDAPVVPRPPTEWARGRAGLLRRWASARVRILVWVVLLLALAGPATLVLQRRVLLQRLSDEVNRELVQEVEEVRVLATGRNPSTGQPFAGDVAAIFDTFLRRNKPLQDETLLALVDGQPYKETVGPYSLASDPALVDRWAHLTDTERGELSTPEGPVRYMAVPLSDRDSDGNRGVFVVANFLQGERDEIDNATRVGAIVYASVFGVAVLMAWLVAGRVLAPVRLITETAKEVTETDLSRRIQVTGRKDEIAELASTFNLMIDRLDHAFRYQREFLDDAGHELRTPITIIRGHLDIEAFDPDELAANRAVIRDELERMARIVDDLLVLGRSEQPDFLQLEAVDLDLLTAELWSKARALADRDWRLVATGHGVLVADRHRLTQAIVNLLDNAARHTAPGTTIELGSVMHEHEASLWVRDHGPGIPDEDQERIFRRFARSSVGVSPHGSAGLGLSIVRAIADSHGGRVDLDSTVGEGATFTFTVPVAAPVGA